MYSFPEKAQSGIAGVRFLARYHASLIENWNCLGS